LGSVALEVITYITSGVHFGLGLACGCTQHADREEQRRRGMAPTRIRDDDVEKGESGWEESRSSFSGVESPLVGVGSSKDNEMYEHGEAADAL